MHQSKNGWRTAFTLVELVVVLSVITILTGILMPAVQQVREAGRRAVCSNRIKQQSLALLAFEAAHGYFPPGAEQQTLHSWSSRILPFLEQGGLYERLDFESRWDSAGNQPAVQTDLTVYSCPSSWKRYPGSTDYAGIRGSSHNARLNLGRNGVLFPVAESNQAIRLAQITDGTSHTIAIGEAVALDEQSHGFWASGLNCIGHDDGSINNLKGSRDEIASFHPGGANVSFADGSTHFFSQSLPLRVIGALCTRSNGEIVDDY